MVFIYSRYTTEILEQSSLRTLLDLFIRYLRFSIVILCFISYTLTVRFLSRDIPTISINDFHVSSQNTSNPLTNTTTIYLDLGIQNENSWVGIYYKDPLNLTIAYISPTIPRNTTSITIGKHTIQGFYQGKGKSKRIQASVVVEDLFSMDDQQRRKLGEKILSLAPQAKVVDLMVYLDAKIKFKSIERKKLDLMLGSAVEVNENTGNSVLNQTIQFKYLSGSNKWNAGQWMLFLPFFILFMVVTFIGVLLPVLFVLLLRG